VAAAACGDGADRAPGGNAIDRHSRHDLALAPGHRPPPLGAAVAPGPLRASGDASQGAVGGAAAGPGERVVGIPADPRRACCAWHRRGAVNGLADPQGRWHQPGSAPRRPRLGGVPAVPGPGDPGTGLHRRSPQRHAGLRPGRHRAPVRGGHRPSQLRQLRPQRQRRPARRYVAAGAGVHPPGYFTHHCGKPRAGQRRSAGRLRALSYAERPAGSPRPRRPARRR
jgi:hypothetical protein